jgi:TolA-binding protein
MTREDKGRRALAALSALARESVQPPTHAELEKGLRAVRSRMADAERKAWGVFSPRQAVLRLTVLATLGATLLLVVLGIIRSEGSRAPVAPSALSYRLEGGSLIEGSYLRELSPSGIRVVFSEGTEFILMPGTRSRLHPVDAAGARITIEHGAASFQVTPAKNRRWQVDVGPFQVIVKGTAFKVSWDAVTERFELRLQRGSVAVSGPLTGGEIALQAGQRMSVDLPRGEALISEHPPEEQLEPPADSAAHAPEPPRHESPVASAEPTVPGGRHGASAARTGDDRGWAAALAAGQLDRILAEAEHAGLKATLDAASSDDLLALADAARYRRRGDLARDALLAQRRRFPGSPHALDAAFLLGRVEEASDKGLARAIQWYNEYLMRAPTGTYASEALGRKMTLTSKLGGISQARPIAEEYLRRFPAGTYAGPARAIVRAP